MTDPVLPAYGTGSIADLLPSIGAHLGMPGHDRLSLPGAERYVVLLIDGLGWEQRSYWAFAAPFLAGLAGAGRAITSGVPSTTATSITSLGTGLVPGQHGIAGYAFRYPATNRVLNTLQWPAEVHGLDVQPQLTYLERLAGAGVRTASVGPARFAGSGLTTVALRDPNFLGVVDEDDHSLRVELVCDASAAGERSVVYAYERSLDHTGHSHGVGSQPWLAALARCDALARSLRAALPSATALVITGDHGMVDVPAASRLVVEDEPGLLEGVTLFAGEGRLRQLYVRDGVGEAVVRRWRERLSGWAWVVSRQEAFDAGWFGEVNPRLADRFGDVLVAMSGDGAVMSRSLPKELSLVGMHGSLTAAEMTVPLLVC
ncbi:MAG: nucleotide pyrophosphatase/phosphodiesterase family protein [Propionicimonas sp.]|nr:alkaline phosphatase family protein [Propionicimonas sp.]